MELKCSIISIFHLFLLLTLPYISKGGSEVADSSEIYEIDYRGPETHSSVIPPPGRSHGRHFINGESSMEAHKSKPSSRGREANGDNNKAKKIHG